MCPTTPGVFADKWITQASLDANRHNDSRVGADTLRALLFCMCARNHVATGHGAVHDFALGRSNGWSLFPATCGDGCGCTPRTGPHGGMILISPLAVSSSSATVAAKPIPSVHTRGHGHIKPRLGSALKLPLRQLVASNADSDPRAQPPGTKNGGVITHQQRNGNALDVETIAAGLDAITLNGTWVVSPASKSDGVTGGAREHYEWLGTTTAARLQFGREDARRCLARRGTLVLGDSTSRFFFAALVDLLDAKFSVPPPLHYLPANDPCSMPAVGWAGGCPRNNCCNRWRGSVYSAGSEVLHSELASFLWVGRAAELTQDRRTQDRLSFACAHADLLVVGAGLWDLLLRGPVLDVDDTVERMRMMIALIDDTCPLATVRIFLGPSGCPNTPGWPPKTTIRSVVALGRGVRGVLNGTEWLYLDRSASQASAPPMPTSMCHQHHGHGVISDTHVQMLLRALCPLPNG